MKRSLSGSRGIALVLCALGFCASGLTCPGGGGVPFFSPLDYLNTSDAVVGGKGKVRVLLVNPASGDTSVALTSSDPSILTVPATVTVPNGHLTADAEYSALAAGDSLITASVGGALSTSTATVYPTLDMNYLSLPGASLEVGAKSFLYAGFNMSLAEPKTIQLTSSDPSIVSVPSTVIVQQFDSSEPAPLTAVAVGTATITAEFEGTTLSGQVSVVSEASLSYISSLDDRLIVGPVDNVYAYLTAIAATPKTITLASSNNSVLSAPANVVVNPGDSSAYFNVSPLAAGSATLTATLGSVSRQLHTTVVTEPSLSSINGPDEMLVGGTGFLYVYLDVEAATQTTVSLTSSDPTVIAVPATVSIPASSSYTFISIQGLSAGATQISADLNGKKAYTPISVSASPLLNYLSVDDLVQTGAVVSGYVSLSQDAISDTTVMLSTSNPASISLPASVVIPAGSSYAYFYGLATAAGYNILTATTSGMSQFTEVYVIDQVSLSSVSGSTTLQVGAIGTLYVYLNATVADDTPITVTNLHPALLSVPSSSLIVPAGSSSATMTGLRALATGRADVQVSFNGDNQLSPYTIVSMPTLLGISTSTTPKVGGVGEMYVYTNAIVQSPQMVTLMSSDATRVTVPASVTIPAGSQYGYFVVNGISANMATITANLGGSMVMTNVTPIP